MEDTYDIEMEGPDHNFVANGIVVHNSQESQRYCNYKDKPLQFICPPDVGLLPGDYEADPTARPMDWFLYPGEGAAILIPETRPSNWLTAMDDAQTGYLYEVSQGKPEDARFLLPNASKTEIVVTMNLRMWRHVFQERALNPAAQWEIRGIFLGIFDEFRKLLPSVFGDLTKGTS